MCSRDALWTWRAVERGYVKSDERESWHSNFKNAVTGSLHAFPLETFTNLHFSGDVTIVDPYVLILPIIHFKICERRT